MKLLSVTDASLSYACFGAFLVAFSMFSLVAKQIVFINEVVLGTLFGILIGPHFAGIFDPRSWGHSDAVTLEVTRVTLAIGLFAIGVELPRSYMLKHAKSLLVMVVPTMAIGWVIVAGFIRVLFPKLEFISCLAVSACLTPTDPIICAAIVGGPFARKNVPEELRNILSAESAANDGLAYPFLTLALYLTLDSTKGMAMTHWILIGCLYQVVLGTVIGAVFGFVFSCIMKFCYQHHFIDRESYVTQYISMTLLTIGVLYTIGSDDLLGAFAAGCAISWDGEFNKQMEGSEFFATLTDFLLNCACFIYIGAWLPFNTFKISALGITPTALVLLSCAVIVLRRIPALLVLYKWIPEIESWKQALFSGHFGPMGVGAVFISTLALSRLPLPTNPPVTQQDYLALSLHPIVSFVVLSSIIIHGLSIPLYNFCANVWRHARKWRFFGRSNENIVLVLPFARGKIFPYDPTTNEKPEFAQASSTNVPTRTNEGVMNHKLVVE